MAKLLDGQLNIVIGRILGLHGGGELEFEPLADEPHSAVVRAGHRLSARADLHHADLRATAGRRRRWTVCCARLDAMFMEHGAPAALQSIIETLSLPLMTSLLRGSDLLAALPGRRGGVIRAGKAADRPADRAGGADGVVRHHPSP
ncbi:LysR substrate-binding domain-containing protein [Xanthomonas theicola]|uniref:LysR substrate-binding domain-containing protein n=1 Tax=Xanthomonas theicola TaxID=56464 RepID=UPI001FEAEEC9|nr:LysR substrate-binding domain-containing protein [Xanthomonas theicola]